MNFTFGIVTDGKNESQLQQIIESIRNEKIPYYEIILAGPTTIVGPDIMRLNNPDDEIHPNGRGWITRKKNKIAEAAKYSNIVFMHDYFMLLPGWYEGWKQFGPIRNYEVCVNNIFTLEGARHSDWVVCPYDMWELFPELKNTWDFLLPTNVNLNRFQYISGGYWVATKQMSLVNPQLEEYAWGQSEDCRWSQKIRHSTQFRFNSYASVQLLRANKWAPRLLPEPYLQFLLRLDVWIRDELAGTHSWMSI